MNAEGSRPTILWGLGRLLSIAGGYYIAVQRVCILREVTIEAGRDLSIAG